MNGLVDLTGQDLLSTGNGKSSHFVTKRFTSTLHFLSSFSTSILDDAVGFDLSLSFGFIDDTLSTLFTVRNNGGGTGAGIGFDGLALLGRDSQSLLTCLLYTSDAADEEDRGESGGSRSIKKNKN